MKYSPEEEKVLKELRARLCKSMGVTMIADSHTITVRFNDDKKNLVQVQLAIVSVDTPGCDAEYDARNQRYEDLIARFDKKYKGSDLAAELFWAEEGEYPQ